MRSGPQVFRAIGQIRLGTDDADLQAALQPALADAGIDHGRFPARVRPDDQDGVGLLDAGDGGVEEIAPRPDAGADLPPILAAVEAGDTNGQPSALSTPAWIPQSQRSPAIAAISSPESSDMPLSNGREGLVPAGFLQLAVAADIGPVQALTLQPVIGKAGPVADPFLVDVFMQARQHSHDFAAPESTRILLPTASMTSIDSVLRSSQDRALKA